MYCTLSDRDSAEMLMPQQERCVLSGLLTRGLACLSSHGTASSSGSDDLSDVRPAEI